MGLFDFGKKRLPEAPDLSFLKDSSQFDFLRTPLLEKPIVGQTLDYFKTPTAAEDVRKSLESELLTQTLADIDLDTERALAEQRAEAYDRGIGGAGISSEIEFSGLGGVRSEGAKRKAGARTGLALGELERTLSKERDLGSVYRELLGLDTGRESTLAQILNARDLGRAGQATSVYDTQSKSALANKGIFEDILRNVSIGFDFEGSSRTS